MVEKAASSFDWRLPLYGSVGATVVVLPSLIYGNDFGAFLFTWLIGAIVASVILVVLLLSVRRQSLAALLMLAVFCAGAWLLFKIADDVRTTGRWLLTSGKLKAEILAQPSPPHRELKHAEWDSWGFAGLDDVVYLVFDPGDSLRGAAASHSPGKYRGIPCHVASVRRLESHWYTVRFYTNTDWNQCG